MGETQERPFQLSFNGVVRVEFQGARVTPDGGLILVRELDERLGLSALMERHLAALILTVFACIEELERELIRESAGTGRVAAIRRGVRFGRPASLSTDQAALAKRFARRGALTFSLGVVSP